MATSKKKTATTTSAPATRKKAPAPIAPPKGNVERDQLLVDNLAATSLVVEAMGLTIEMLVEKIESIAHHVIATEEIIAELVADNGLNLARVNARIRAKVLAGTDNGNPNPAIDVAALIASPLGRD